ncbi:homocysteine-responsive endoplasmic reticulum-resident ubiquitin-like domain member 2 protein [Euwallacea similis]|uniref:homocysteine-responsive endoplasmic reticulum-resident ubiquitin-like domain member 2 protein n=1 Tax=Euwallacea similis TaxID=1736056 RepID=UPI003450858F
MDSLPVTLIVKAPNQQIEDQKIRCETSWTINKLKEHLSEVYPSKPPHQEQKLIYSGQLLNDSVVLKDVLRQYEGQDTHTVHLVCTPKAAKMTQNTTPNTTAGASPGNSTSATNPTPPEVTASQIRVETDNTTRVPPTYPWASYTGQFQSPADVNNMLNQYQLQMALMQQAYMQYMAQYMQMASGQPPTAPSPLPQTPGVPPPPNAQPNAAEPAQPNVAPQQPQENEERDWLDVFYMLSRAMVLFSVVYFYSSPVRFIFVLFLGVALYLYQSGFFRNININNNNINGTPEGAPEEEQAPTRFTVAWTFITTFFASLIPEIPNINA